MRFADVIGKENRKMAIEECDKAIKSLEAERKCLEEYKLFLTDYEPNANLIRKTIKTIITAKESGISSVAKVQLLTNKTDSLETDEEDVLSQIADDFNITVEFENGIFKVKAPSMFLKEGSASFYSRMIGRAAYTKVWEYIRNNNLITPLFEKAYVDIVHHIPNDITYRNVPDSDNMDSKGILDSIDGLVIPNDDILTVRLSEYGVKDSGPHTELLVREMDE